MHRYDDGRRQDAAAMSSACCALSTDMRKFATRLPASRAFSSLGSPSHHLPPPPSTRVHVARSNCSFLMHERLVISSPRVRREGLIFCSSLNPNLLHAYTIKGEISFCGNSTARRTSRFCSTLAPRFLGSIYVCRRGSACLSVAASLDVYRQRSAYTDTPLHSVPLRD